jgi:hypothetical protein
MIFLLSTRKYRAGQFLQKQIRRLACDLAGKGGAYSLLLGNYGPTAYRAITVGEPFVQLPGKRGKALSVVSNDKTHSHRRSDDGATQAAGSRSAAEAGGKTDYIIRDFGPELVFQSLQGSLGAVHSFRPEVQFRRVFNLQHNIAAVFLLS